MSWQREEAALGGDEPEELGRQAGDADLVENGATSALTCSSAVKTGLRIRRSTSGCVCTRPIEAVEIAADRIDGIRFLSDLEQRRGIAPGHT